MSYEAGSKECRHLIEAKESLLSTLDALSNIHSTDLMLIEGFLCHTKQAVKNVDI